MMDVEASDKPKNFVGKDDRTEPVSCEKISFDDDDDIPLSQKMPSISSLGMCSSKCDDSVKKRDTATLPVKRVFDNNNTLCGSMNKSKVSATLYDHNADDDDNDAPLSKRLFRPSSLGMCSSKRDASVKKRDTATLPVKRVFDNNNTLCGSMKKSKVSPTLYDHNDDDDNDVPLSKRLSWPSSLGMCSSKRDASVKKRDTATLPVKRVFDNNNTLCGSMNKSMVSQTLYDHNGNDDDNDDIPLSKRLSRLSGLGTCSTKRDSSVKKSDTTKVPVKILFDNSKSLCGSMKKFKVSPTTYDDNDDDDDDVLISSMIKMPAMSTGKSFSSLKKELALVENSFVECKRMQQEEEKRLQSIKKDIEKFSKELGNKKIQVRCVRRINEIHKKLKGKIEECVKDFVAKEGKLYLMEELIGERKQELHEVMDNISKRKHFETKVKEFESKEKRFEMKVKETVKHLVLMQAHFDSQVKEFESNKKQHEGLVKDHKSKVKEFEAQVKELESKKKHFEFQVEKLKPKERQLRGQVEELESKEKQLDSRVKEFVSKKDKFEGRVKELESGKKHFERRLKDLESKGKKFEGQVKEFQPKAEKFNGESKAEFEGQVKKFKLKKKQFESQVEDKFNVPVKELKLKEVKFDGQIKDPELKQIKLDEEKEFVTSYMDNELFRTVDDGTSLELLPSEQTDILVNLLESSDPAKVVLDIIQNPIIPLCKDGDNGEIIAGYHIYLLEQLMRISPDIKPCVRKEALKLALDLKANMKENNENSLVVLGFLLLLSIYGLVSFFNEDYILELLHLLLGTK